MATKQKNTIALTFSAAQKRNIEAAARVCGVRSGDFIRNTVLNSIAAIRQARRRVAKRLAEDDLRRSG